MQIYKATFIDTPSPNDFRIRADHYAVVQDGRIESISSELPVGSGHAEPIDLGPGFVIPSFIDLHVHAPQHMQMGAGLDLPLLQWLESYTFPGEARYANREYAADMYAHFARELKRQGSLRSVVFATVHRGATDLLAQALDDEGLSALVGKVNMDRNCPPELAEDPEASLRASEDFCRNWMDHPRIQPIVTPRFAPTCSSPLMSSLGDLAEQMRLPVQTHLAETEPEVSWVSELFPENSSYTQVYHSHGLLKEGSLMAHAIYLNEEELELIQHAGAWLVHCPSANVNLSSGIMPLSSYWKRGVQLGLGSDVGAGHSLSMARAITQAVQMSKILTVMKPEEKHEAVSLSQAFYLATAANGRYVSQYGPAECGPCGIFDEGMSFDALAIDMHMPAKADLSHRGLLERFLYCGDDRNISGRFLSGRRL